MPTYLTTLKMMREETAFEFPFELNKYIVYTSRYTPRCLARSNRF